MHIIALQKYLSGSLHVEFNLIETIFSTIANVYSKQIHLRLVSVHEQIKTEDFSLKYHWHKSLF